MYTEVIEQLTEGKTLKERINNDDIVAIRLQGSNEDSTSVDKSFEAGDGNRSTVGAWNDTTRKATISVFTLLACSVLVIAAVGIYRKKSTSDRSGGSIDSSCDGSIDTGDQNSDSDGTPTQDQFDEGHFSVNDWKDEC